MQGKEKTLNQENETRNAGTKNLCFPAGQSGIVALMDRDMVFVADVRCKADGIFIHKAIEQRISRKEEGNEPEPEELIQAMELALEKGGFSGKDLIISLPGSYFSLDIVSFPPLKRKPLEELINRKVLKSGIQETGQDAWCYEVIEEKHGGTDKGTKVLTARISASKIERLHAALEEKKIRPAALTMPAAGIISTIRHAFPDTFHGPVLAIEVSATGAGLSLFENKVLRQIRHTKKDVLAETANFKQILDIEVKRTHSFYKERFKGKNIEGVVLSSC